MITIIYAINQKNNMALKLSFTGPVVAGDIIQFSHQGFIFSFEYQDYSTPRGLYKLNLLPPFNIGLHIVTETADALIADCPFLALTRHVVNEFGIGYIIFNSNDDDPITDLVIINPGSNPVFGEVSNSDEPPPYIPEWNISNEYTNSEGFTLDVKYFNIFCSDPLYYFQVKAKITTNLFSGGYKNYEIKNKYIPFQRNIKFNLGQTIHKLMDRFSYPFGNIGLNDNYAQAILNLEIQCKKIADNTTVDNRIVPTILFTAGLSKYSAYLGILDFNLKKARTYNGNKLYININSGADQVLQIFMNNVLQNTIPLDSGIQTYIYEVNGIPGTEIRFDHVGNNATSTKKYIIFPKQLKKYSNNIFWENEFLLQSHLDCTGNYSLKSDFEYISFKSYHDFVEKLEYLDNNKTNVLSINTGFILKSEIDSIESLIRSKRVWIEIDSKMVEIRPISKSIVNIDSEKEYIEYTLEFQINRKTNEETYTL